MQQSTAAQIVTALESGSMATVGFALSRDEKLDIAYYITGREAEESTIELADFACTPRTSSPIQFAAVPEEASQWNGWGGSLANQRHQPRSEGLAPDTVTDLELQWVFAVPNATRSRAQPVVTPEAVFVGSQQGVVYALDPTDGCPIWLFHADAEVRGSVVLGYDSQRRPETLYFGDFKANAYAIDAGDGTLRWKTRVHEHPRATITGSVTLHEDQVIVPVSSGEVILAARDEYACCTFRGAVVALDARDGSIRWRTFTVDEPRPTSENALGVWQQGPSGAPVWSAPTIDAERGLVYAATGQNYSSPATGTSDAVLALDIESGDIEWVSQVTEGDAWNGACSTGGANCPAENGPDFDIGASPILTETPSGRDLLFVGQKSGMTYAMDPEDQGAIVWRTRVGRGGTMGGVHHGMASDGDRLYVGVFDQPSTNAYAEGDPRPGLHALDLDTGEFLWRHDLEADCEPQPFACWHGISAPVSSTGELIFAGSMGGTLRAFDARDGSVLWQTQARGDFGTAHGIQARGGSIEADGPVLAGGKVYVTSGYEKWGETPGNVLLVYGLPESSAPGSLASGTPNADQ